MDGVAPQTPSLRQLPLPVALWRVAWPMVAIGWLRTLLLLTDAWWVGGLGPWALEALAAASFAVWMLDHAGELAAVGVHARVAQAEGAERPDRFAPVVFSGVALSAVVWLTLVAGGGPLVGGYVGALGLGPELAGPTGDFLRVSVVAAPGLFAMALVGGVFRGLGRTRDALVVTGAGLLLNVGLDPWFIYGGWGVPAQGLVGAAQATGVASALAAIVGAMWLWRDGVVGLRVPEVGEVGQVARIGAPLAVTGWGFAAVYVVLGRLIGSFGSAELAAMGIGHRLEGVPYLAGVGVAVAVSTLVGQHVGAGDAASARAVVRAAARGVDAVMVLSALIAVFFAEAIYGWFTEDAAIIAAGGVYLRWQALVWLGMGRELLYEGAFTGAGRTAPAMVWGGGLTLLRIPLAFGLAMGLGWGIQGVWIAIALSTAGKGLALGWRWGAGRWVEPIEGGGA